MAAVSWPKSISLNWEFDAAKNRWKRLQCGQFDLARLLQAGPRRHQFIVHVGGMADQLKGSVRHASSAERAAWPRSAFPSRRHRRIHPWWRILAAVSASQKLCRSVASRRTCQVRTSPAPGVAATLHDGSNGLRMVRTPQACAARITPLRTRGNMWVCLCVSTCVTATPACCSR